jgi:proteasome assembly chaperone 2
MTLEDRLFYPSPPSSPLPPFKSSTLLIPSISIGNVPQLALDLLITTLKIPLVGYLTSPYLVPCAGTREGAFNPFTGGGIACPLEGILLQSDSVDVV